VDDFEGSQSTIVQLILESFFHPDRNVRSTYDFNAISDLSYGFKRAKLAWYSIDPIFYTQNLLDYK
jgi:cell surface protein SprA